MSRSVRPDYEALRAAQARLQQADRIGPDPQPNCPKRIMDGRNELRCWFLEGHEGECK